MSLRELAISNNEDEDVRLVVQNGCDDNFIVASFPLIVIPDGKFCDNQVGLSLEHDVKDIEAGMPINNIEENKIVFFM